MKVSLRNMKFAEDTVQKTGYDVQDLTGVQEVLEEKK